MREPGPIFGFVLVLVQLFLCCANLVFVLPARFAAPRLWQIRVCCATAVRSTAWPGSASLHTSRSASFGTEFEFASAFKDASHFWFSVRERRRSFRSIPNVGYISRQCLKAPRFVQAAKPLLKNRNPPSRPFFHWTCKRDRLSTLSLCTRNNKRTQCASS